MQRRLQGAGAVVVVVVVVPLYIFFFFFIFLSRSRASPCMRKALYLAIRGRTHSESESGGQSLVEFNSLSRRGDALDI